jgi:hypothetical protein
MSSLHCGLHALRSAKEGSASLQPNNHDHVMIGKL